MRRLKMPQLCSGVSAPQPEVSAAVPRVAARAPALPSAGQIFRVALSDFLVAPRGGPGRGYRSVVAQALSYEEALLWLNDQSGQRMGVWLLRGDVDRGYQIVLTADIGDLQHHTQFLPLPGPLSSNLADRPE